jgi:hypothetical protein
LGFEIDFVESYDREGIISELRRVAKALGKDTLSRRDIDSHGRLSSGVVIKKFGSLRRALQEAELRPTRFMKGTDEELFAVLIQLWTLTLEKFGRSPLRRELRDYEFPVSGDTYIRRFGSWKRALLAAAQSVSAEGSESVAVPETVTVKDQGSTEDRKSLSVRKRFFVFKRDRYRCRICGRSGVELEVDHRIPVAQGGSDALDNLQTLCRDCNRGKRDSFE